VFDLLEEIGSEGKAFSREQREPERQVVMEVAEQLDETGRAALQGVTLRDLVDRLQQRRAKP